MFSKGDFFLWGGVLIAKELTDKIGAKRQSYILMPTFFPLWMTSISSSVAYENRAFHS